MADGRLIVALCCMISMYKLTLVDSVQCQVCSGPPFLCEQLHHEETCNSSPNNVCVNQLINYQTGSRQVTRMCGTRAVCDVKANASSHDTRCTTFDPSFVQTLGFECYYCCDTDNCNVDIVPTVAWTSVG